MSDLGEDAERGNRESTRVGKGSNLWSPGSREVARKLLAVDPVKRSKLLPRQEKERSAGSPSAPKVSPLVQTLLTNEKRDLPETLYIPCFFSFACFFLYFPRRGGGSLIG